MKAITISIEYVVCILNKFNDKWNILASYKSLPFILGFVSQIIEFIFKAVYTCTRNPNRIQGENNGINKIKSNKLMYQKFSIT